VTTYEEGESSTIVTSRLGLQDMSNVTRYVFLSVFTFSDNRGSEDRIGGRNSSGDDESWEKLESGDNGEHESSSDHPSHQHAEKKTSGIVSIRFGKR